MDATTTTVPGTDNPDGDEGIRRPDDDAGLVLTGAVNSDSVGDIRRDDSDAGVGVTVPDDSDSTVAVGWSGDNAGVGAGLVNLNSTVESGRGGDDAGIGATGLVNSDSGTRAGRSDEVAEMGFLGSATWVPWWTSGGRLEALDFLGLWIKTTAAWASWVGFGVVTDNGRQRVRATGSTTGSSWASSGRILLLAIWAIEESAMDREVTHVIPTTVMNRDVI